MASNEWINNSDHHHSLFNNTDNDDGQFLSYLLGYFVQGLYGTVFVVGLLGNTLVIYVVLRYTKMQTVTNLYILNLAVADECFLIGIPFLMTTVGLGFWPFGNLMCKVYMTTTSVNQFTSSLLLTVMSADRYIAVCHPINSPKFRTPMISKAVSLAAWGASFLMIVPIVLYSNTEQVGADWLAAAAAVGAGSLNDTNETLPTAWSLKKTSGKTGGGGAAPGGGGGNNESCNIFWPENEYMNGQAAFTLYTFTLAFAIPLILILVFYILVIRKLQTVGPTNKSKEKKRSHRKVTRLVLTVVTVYVLCWLPYWVSQVSLIFTEPQSKQSPIMVTVFLLAGCLGYSNSAVNPILYAFLSDNFKKSFMKACTCATRRDVNNALTGENSVFTRRGRSSERGGTNASRSRSRGTGAATGRTLTIAAESEGDLMPNNNSAPDPSTAVTLISRSLAAGPDPSPTHMKEVLPLLSQSSTPLVSMPVNGSDIIHSQL